MADNPSEKKISEASGVKAVLDEAAERIEATWREKLLRETARPQDRERTAHGPGG